MATDETAKQPPPRTLDEAAAAAPALPFSHLFAALEDDDKSSFARRLCRMLDHLTRIEATVVHLSTTVVADEDGLRHVAQIVVRMDLQLLAQLTDNDSGTIELPEEPERLIGFRTP